jgi:hypothetical protein
MATLIAELVPAADKGFTFDWNNEVFTQTCITHGGDINSRRKA